MHGVFVFFLLLGIGASVLMIAVRMLCSLRRHRLAAVESAWITVWGTRVAENLQRAEGGRRRERKQEKRTTSRERERKREGRQKSQEKKQKRKEFQINDSIDCNTNKYKCLYVFGQWGLNYRSPVHCTHFEFVYGWKMSLWLFFLLWHKLIKLNKHWTGGREGVKRVAQLHEGEERWTLSKCIQFAWPCDLRICISCPIFWNALKIWECKERLTLDRFEVTKKKNRREQNVERKQTRNKNYNYWMINTVYLFAFP